MGDVSRRDLFRIFGRRVQPAPRPVAEPDPLRVALVSGRHCLALTSRCSVCIEQCPIPGAMQWDAGLPMVNPDICNGCRICQQVCPAPTNAIRMLPRPPGSNQSWQESPG